MTAPSRSGASAPSGSSHGLGRLHPGGGTTGGPLFLLPLAGLALVTLPGALQVGMFSDGVTFAAIARNFADGLGSFWAPYYTDTAHPRFLEFLPLGLWLQSWVYRIFGDHLALDTVWGLAMGLVLVVLVVPAWRLGWPGGRPPCGAWWPALLFVSFPMTARVLSHNLLESTMAVFVLAAATAAAAAVASVGTARLLAWSVLAAVFLIAAVLSKGPQSTFPLVLPVVAALCFPGAVRWSRAWTSAVAMTAVLALGLGALHLVDPGARDAFDAVLSERILRGVRGQREVAATRLAILGKLALELAVPLAMAGLASLVTRAPARVAGNRRLGLFLALGGAGSLPFALSLHQYGRYLFLSLPFFAMAVASLFAAAAERVEARVRERTVARGLALGIAALTAAVAVVLMVVNAGTVRRAQEFHADLTLQALPLRARALVAVCPAALAADWEVVANMQRVYRASLVPRARGDVLLVEDDRGCVVPPACRLLQRARPTRYFLYACETSGFDPIPRR